MTKRLLMLVDDEIERLLDWYDLSAPIRSTDEETEDEALADKLREARLR